MAKKEKTIIKDEEIKEEEVPTAKKVEAEVVEEPIAEVVEEEVIDPIEALTAQVETEKNNALRHLADLENFKKRKQTELESFRKYASEGVLIEFLPLLDSLNMAFLSIEHTEDKNIKYGLELIKKQLESTLEKLNVEQIKAAENDVFDTNLHQAISQEKSKAHKENTIVKVMQKGYQLNSKVIRPAMVVVAE